MHKELWLYFYEQEQVNTHATSWYNANTSICLISSFPTQLDLQNNGSATQQLKIFLLFKGSIAVEQDWALSQVCFRYQTKMNRFVILPT